MLRQRAGDEAGLVPIRRPGIEPHIGEGILQDHAVEAVRRDAPGRFLQREAGIDAGENAELEVFPGAGAQVRRRAGYQGKAQRRSAGSL